MPTAGEDEKQAARVFYEVATRATQWLGVGGGGAIGGRISSPQHRQNKNIQSIFTTSN